MDDITMWSSYYEDLEAKKQRDYEKYYEELFNNFLVGQHNGGLL